MDRTTNPITIPRIIGRMEELDEDELVPVPLPVPVPVPVPVSVPVPFPVGVVGVPTNKPPFVLTDTEVVLLVT